MEVGLGNNIATEPSFSRSHLVKVALWLSWFTIIYNIGEGIVSIYFGIDEASIALFGFGMDSFIESFSAIVVLWRFREEAGVTKQTSFKREQSAASSIGTLLIALAIITAVSSGLQILEHRPPTSTFPGVVISLLSLSFMFFLWSKKKQIGTRLNSTTMLNDAACSLACIKLSVILLVGSLTYMLVPSLWWMDSVAALVMSFFIAKEGYSMRVAAKSGKIGCSDCGCG